MGTAPPRLGVGRRKPVDYLFWAEDQRPHEPRRVPGGRGGWAHRSRPARRVHGDFSASTGPGDGVGVTRVQRTDKDTGGVRPFG